MDIQPHVPNIENNELQWVVARIQSRRPSQALPRPKPATLATVIAYLREEESLTAEELSERECEWDAMVNELQAVEQADARKEGQL